MHLRRVQIKKTTHELLFLLKLLALSNFERERGRERAIANVVSGKKEAATGHFM